MWTLQRRRALAAGIALTWMLFAWSSPAFALNPALDVSQYAHTSWKIRDGFTKGTITSIAQTQDGYLLLGTEFGLLRFDGVRAVPWQPPGEQRLPSSNIRSLLVTRDGTLLIGTDRGLASWKDGKLTAYAELRGNFIARLLEDRDGSIWITRVSTSWTLCAIWKGRVQCHGEDGGPGSDALGLYEDSQANLWVGTRTGIWRWRPGPPTFYPLPFEDNGIRGFSEDDDGTLLISQGGAIRRLAHGTAQIRYPFPPSMGPAQAPVLLRDRDGGLWIGGSGGGGLAHVHQELTDAYRQIDGLSGNSITALFEDREGNVWVATGDGLDRFRDAAVASFSVAQGLSSANVSSIFTSVDGSAWVGTFDGLNRWTRGQITVYRERNAQAAPGIGPYVSHTLRHVTVRGMPAGGVQSIFEDSHRRVWVSTFGGVGYFENDRFVRSGIAGGLTRAIAEDTRGNVWIANRDAGLFRVARDSDDVEQIPWTRLNHADRVSALAGDPSKGGLWLGYAQGGIAYFADGQVRASYTAADGLAEGRVSAVQPARDGAVWVATDGGLSLLKAGRAVTLTRGNGLPCDAVGWVIEDDDRSLWLGMPCGLVRVARADIDGWIAGTGTGSHHNEAAHPIRTTVFDQADGARMFVIASYYTAPVAKATDGRLWFPSQDGVSVVDPHRLPFNPLPPPVHVEQVIADRKTYDVGVNANGHVDLPALTRDLQIDFTALSLVAPEKNRFRIKLEGWDGEWQDVGNRREAFYNNLPPRTYRFRVIASNNSGVWNETGAVLDFSVAPAYYQTSWFGALSIASLIALVWGGHRIRLRIVEKHERQISALNERLMKAQEQERIRIAGELHDGVMQDMLAVTMMLGSAKRRIPDENAKATIDKAQQKLVQAGTEIRQLSHDLHPPLLQEAGLPSAVTAYCEQFSAASGIPVACEADEHVRELSRGAALALFRIVQEALGNAAKHAAARHIVVRLTRSDGVVTLTVSDDGVGLDRGKLASGGGLGLVMMRERATQLNGTFEFESAPGRGTTIKVVIPFR